MNPAYCYVLTLSCPDKPGIVHAVSGFLSTRGINILTSAQYGDEASQQFFMRVKVDASAAKMDLATLESQWAAVAKEWQMEATWHALAEKTRVMLMVSKAGHCLNDLLFRWQEGSLPIDIVAVGSNHDKFRSVCEAHDLPFYHWPLTSKDDNNRAEQEAKLKVAVETHNVDLVVLARYMQILSPDLCAFLNGRAINIHHSFLPSFKGARPYHQAHAKGVKLIGATAHYVTTDLDEGPIIEQDVARVNHSMDAAKLTEIGHDIERLVLARALRSHCEHRVLRNGNKTVVFA
ncbi:formyltetrahydrofolate deformylase [Suttonella sp. R2A3]|uniref:formyltetrahydrofolate deformylase n=1 Tax=Suttonella sp. R2A3 TaxID=2908648 RepID=UPI001F42C9B4|nr:formyltetrahydrofolate deformylase [Suttonella sp. R2A3]UJF23792.1 formyltetrahydrofolate deformylase [Suttonella sp. R2A3]